MILDLIASNIVRSRVADKDEMAIHAEAVEILVRKARFEPEVALGVAEAIEVSMTLSQLVTVPVLDARLLDLKHELKAEIQALGVKLEIGQEKTKSELVRWVFLTMLGSVALSAGATFVLKAFS
jgi:hypothetical protein